MRSCCDREVAQQQAAAAGAVREALLSLLALLALLVKKYTAGAS